MRVPSDDEAIVNLIVNDERKFFKRAREFGFTPDEVALILEINRKKKELALLEEDLRILRSNQPQRPAISASILGVNPELIGDDGK